MDDLENELLEKEEIEYLNKRKSDLISEISTKTNTVFTLIKFFKKSTDELEDICRLLNKKTGQSYSDCP